MEINKNYLNDYIKPSQPVKQEPYVGSDGIYVPLELYARENAGVYKMFMSKDIFVEAYNKWIKGENDETVD